MRVVFAILYFALVYRLVIWLRNKALKDLTRGR